MSLPAQQWSCRIGALGEILQGADDIEQQIAIVLQSPPGCDPLRPDFAVDLLSLIDRPFQEMRAQAILRISQALDRWMDGQIVLDTVQIAPTDALATRADIVIAYRLPVAPERLRTLILPLAPNGKA